MQPTAESESLIVFMPAGLLLAQDNQAAPAVGANPSTAQPTGANPGANTSAGTTGAPGGTGGGTGIPPARQTGPFDPQFLVMIVLLVVGMIVFSLMGQRRDRKKREAMISAIKKHDRVQTIGGVIGSVAEVKPDYVVLKVDESSNTRITFSRAAIAQVLSAAPETNATAKLGGPEQATP